MASDDVQRFKPVGADGPEVVLASDFDAMRQRAEKAEARIEELAAMVRATLS